jgi:hypothetical protein
MCYIQLSLWGVPAVVVVGNTLANECREAFYTIGHHMGGWKWKLARHTEEHTHQEQAKPVATTTDEARPTTTAPPEPKPFAPVASRNQAQIGFDF